MSQEIDTKIQEVYRHIQTERKILEASQLLRQATTNQEVLRRNDAKIRETERSLSYFEDTLKELQARKQQGLGPTDRPRSNPNSPQVPPKNYGPGSGPGYPGAGPMGRPGPGAPAKRNYSKLELIMADTPHTPAKISKMLEQLQFKLQVENQYKQGIEKMAKLYQAEGDKKSKADAESKRIESDRKIQLLETSLKRYKSLHIIDDVGDDEDTSGPGMDGERKENLRAKPISGTLHVTVKGARELEHAPVVTSFKSRSASKSSDTTVTLKVEGTQLARSHPSRTDRWNEVFEISVDKANEVEIQIADQQVGSANAVPIGLLWIRISDLVEALRRQRTAMETGQGGWVTAGAMHGDATSPTGQMGYSGGFGDAPLNNYGGGPSGPPPGAPPMGMGGASASDGGIDAWFAVEPVGAIALNLNFIKENVRKRPMDAGGLGRQGAVKKRKEEVHEMNGHKFVQKQFYQLMLCAFCSEFLLNALGYQCEDCRYTCHKKCYDRVVTKCIAKSTSGEDADKINHRIPHRFEPLTNLSANWCCHCGYMLPLGRKNARKCSECDITCHANCAHLVPDFCGMSMETASALLSATKNIRRNQEERAQRPPPKERMHSAPSPSPQDLSQRFGNMQMGPGGPGGPGSQAPPLGMMDQGPGGRRPSQPPMDFPTGPAPGYSATPPPQQAPPYSQQGGPGPGGRPPQPPGRVPVPGFPEQGRPPPGAYDPSQMPPDGFPGHRPQQPSGGARPSLPSGPSPTPGQRPPGRPGSGGPIATPPPPGPQPPARQQTRKRKVGLDDFNFLAVLGKGNFGKVMLAEEKKTNGLYAIKVLKKEFIIDNDEVESTRSEKRVFLAAARERHPFLLGLHSCFQTETRVYFVMEYVSGGDLMLHIQRKQFSLRQAKFYASEVLLALEYFHSQGIIYRDLKLDNILLTLDGHVKVADYGLCKEDMWYGQTTSTFCGTPEFMAPEILLEQRYGRAVDWWAFGVLTYEMLLGQSPFRGDDEDEIFDAILEDEPLYPITMPRDAVSILQKLLTRDPNRRLGSGKDDAEDIKRQPFFKDTSWDDVFNKRIPVPYKPTISGSADTSNFDEEFTKEQPTLTPVHTQLSSRDQAEFTGFSWVAAWADI